MFDFDGANIGLVYLLSERCSNNKNQIKFVFVYGLQYLCRIIQQNKINFGP